MRFPVKGKKPEIKSKPEPKKFVTKTTTKPTVTEPVVKVGAEEFKGAVRNALQACPRRPTAQICGYGGIDSKGKKYDTCLLPSDHNGPHMHVDPAEISVKVERELIISTEITFDFERESIPRELTDILYAWRKMGNPWATSLELDLQVFSKGLKFEHTIDNINAVRALWYLGFMDKQDLSGREHMPVTRYRLSKKGLAATNTIAKLIGDIKPDAVALNSMVNEEETDCSVCDGDGFVEGSVCIHCDGTGTEPPKKVASKGRVSSPEKKSPPARMTQAQRDANAVSTSRVIRGENSKPTIKAVPKMVDCERCNGEGLIKGKVCSGCKGLGEVETTPTVSTVSTVRKFPRRVK